jgi:hypothetical protein
MDHLVLDKETGEWRFFGFTTSTADVMFRQIREDVMPRRAWTSPTCRSTPSATRWLTRLAQGGMDLARSSNGLGHSDPKITAERYLHLIPSDLVAGLAILNGTGGTQDAYKAPDRTKPVSVPNTRSDAIGASGGTVSLQ